MSAPPALAAAASWLTAGPLLRRGRDGVAFCHGYDLRRRRADFVYHEVTGYGASFLTRLARWTGEPATAALAREAGEYLLARHRESLARHGLAAVTHSVSFEGQEDARLYTFDNGMIALGLLDVAEATGRADMVEAARAILDWILGLRLPSGGFRARLDGPGGADRHVSPGFADDEGALHAKLALPLLRLAAASGEARYAEEAARLLQWAGGLQDEEGFFWANGFRRCVSLHAHAYACEGFLLAAGHLDEEGFARRARAGLDWMRRVQDADGALPFSHRDRLHRQEKRWRVADATAQAVRLWLLAGGPGARAAAERGAAFLVSLQVADGDDPAARGGLRAHDHAGWLGRGRADLLPAWSAMFAAHAFWLLGGGEPRVEELF